MKTIALTGGSGFVGRHLIASFLHTPDVALRVLSRSPPPAGQAATERVTWIRGDLENTAALRALMAGSSTFVHLAYAREWEIARHLAAAERLATIAADSPVKRMIHCSTAVVVGSATGRVTENTPCQPQTKYEQAKAGIERALTEGVKGRCEMVVLRPTAVFGPGGQNLVKLASALQTGRRPLNYARSSLFARRRMNLVCIANVIGALRFLVDAPRELSDHVYIVSDDDDPANRFADVEAILMSALEVAPYRIRPVHVPSVMLSATLKLAGRSADVQRWYDASRLRQAGCPRSIALTDGLLQFAQWFRQQPR